MVETLIERLSERWDVHSCIICVKTGNKEEGMIALIGVYTAICRAMSKSAKTAFIVWISWKNLMIVRYTCVPNWKNTCTVTPLKYIYIYTVFPTHRLYLGGPPRYINGRPSIFGHTILFLLLLLSLTLFLSARDDETICDQLTSGKSPLARRVSFCSFCVLKNCDTPTDDLQCFPYAGLFVAGRNNIHQPLPSAPASHTRERNFSTIFSNLDPFGGFFPITDRYRQT